MPIERIKETIGTGMFVLEVCDACYAEKGIIVNNGNFYLDYRCKCSSGLGCAGSIIPIEDNRVRDIISCHPNFEDCISKRPLE